MRSRFISGGVQGADNWKKRIIQFMGTVTPN
jgi:hypothetical protein